MIAPAVSTGIAVEAWICLAIGLVLAVVALALLHATLRPILEIRRYADHILQAGLGIAGNVDAVDELGHTRDLATAMPRLATAYLDKLQRTP